MTRCLQPDFRYLLLVSYRRTDVGLQEEFKAVVDIENLLIISCQISLHIFIMQSIHIYRDQRKKCEILSFFNNKIQKRSWFIKKSHSNDSICIFCQVVFYITNSLNFLLDQQFQLFLYLLRKSEKLFKNEINAGSFYLSFSFLSPQKKNHNQYLYIQYLCYR